jgi:hypothetical protein
LRRSAHLAPQCRRLFIRAGRQTHLRRRVHRVQA